MRALRSLVLGALLLGAAAAPARAADPRPPPADAAAQARRYYEDGVAAAAEKEWQKAYNALAEAWKLKQHWQIAVNLGQAELKVGKLPDAAEHIDYYLREATELQPDDARQAREWLEQARSKIGILQLNVAPKGAQVMVDGKLVGTAPIGHDTYVESGWHVVEAHTADGKALRQVEAPVGKPIEVLLGVGGAVPVPLASAQASSAPSPASPLLGPRTIGAGAGAAVALVNLIVGAAFAGASASKGSAEDKLCKVQCPQSTAIAAQWTKLEGERVGSANASVAAFVVGGVALAGSVAAFVLLAPRPAAPAAAASLRVSPGLGGFALSGSF
jgi:hypothetical protein